MKNKLFSLKREDKGLVPNDGEMMGVHLFNAAYNTDNLRHKAALYHLAADAYDLGAQTSMGHNRADRYRESAKELRKKAEELIP